MERALRNKGFEEVRKGVFVKDGTTIKIRKITLGDRIKGYISAGTLIGGLTLLLVGWGAFAIIFLAFGVILEVLCSLF